MSTPRSINVSASIAIADSEAVDENFTTEAKFTLYCLFNSLKELIITSNISYFAAFKDSLAKRTMCTNL